MAALAGVLLLLVTHLARAASTPPVVEQRTVAEPLASAAQQCEGVSCLQSYVDFDDGHFSYEDLQVSFRGRDLLSGVSWQAHVLNMTSQKWLTASEVSQSVWWHILVVVVPDNLQHTSNGVLWITGGDNKITSTPIPNAKDEDVNIAAYLACHSGIVSAALYQVPNQPLYFASDPTHKRRVEDASIAFTWKHFVEVDPNTPEWLLRFPMTKAAKRALDAVEDWTAKQNIPVKTWAAGGASKRGWTTWTLGAVVPSTRLPVIFPVVMDDLNFVANLHHHYRAYGGWSFALGDYYSLNFTSQIDNPNTKLMQTYIDPYFYPERYSDKAILVVNSCMDEFFLPDDTRWWWKSMEGQKDFLIVPNAEHTEITGILEILPSAVTLLRARLHGIPAPKFNWTIDANDGHITVYQISAHKPKAVHMWHAETCNSERRDFRILNGDPPEKCKRCGRPIKGPFGSTCVNLRSFWTPTRLSEHAPGVWKASRPVPTDGRWVAFFVHVAYEGPARPKSSRRALHDWPIGRDGDFEFTTEVSILPQTFPFPDCHGPSCRGKLV